MTLRPALLATAVLFALPLAACVHAPAAAPAAKPPTTQEVLDGHEKRKSEVRAKFDADIARYRELINRPSIR